MIKDKIGWHPAAQVLSLIRLCCFDMFGVKRKPEDPNYIAIVLDHLRVAIQTVSGVG